MNRESLFEALEEVRVAAGGELTPADVVAAARPKSSPLHPFFTWDQKEAAAAYLLSEAASLIRRVRVRVEYDDRPAVTVRAYTSVIPVVDNADEDEAPPQVHAYLPTSMVAADPVLRDQQIAVLKGELRSTRRRLEHFEVFAGVAAAIDQVL